MDTEIIFIARQPIFDRENRLIGYELLYRAGDTDEAKFDDGNLASTEVILNTFMNIGIDNLVGSSLAFINLTEAFLINESLTPEFEHQAVLEILEDVRPSYEVVEGMKKLKDLGYKIALDDFKFSPEYDPVLKIVDFVKIDVLAMSTTEIVEELEHLKNYGFKLIAERVETHELYQFCHHVGFDGFQGFHFCKPELVTRTHIPANKLVVLNIFKKLEDPNFSFHDISTTLANDVTLTFKLLRYVNGAAFAHRKEIESIEEALILVGSNTIKKWSILILMTQLAEGKPRELLVTALVRARMCELLAEEMGANRDQMFTIGLLSLLDALMGIEMVDLLDELALSITIKTALLDYEGVSGEILFNVINYEQGKWDKLQVNGVDVKSYIPRYMEAVMWADETVMALL